jgi:DNA-binding CsgD family transcriptional regulator
MVCPACGTQHPLSATCQRLQQVVLSLNLFTVPAFLTDPLNRFVFVNQTFGRMIGDPIRDLVHSNMRFIVAAIVGPYRDRFPWGRREVAQCISGLVREVKAGRLAKGTGQLLEDTLALDEDLTRMVRRTDTPWDGTVVVKDNTGKMSLVREQVVAVADPWGRDSGFHVSWWLPAEKGLPEILAGLSESPTGVAATLTPRQLEVARWYAVGLNSRGVAARAGITLGTARAHLEEIYSRLEVHSHAELTARLIREGLV